MSCGRFVEEVALSAGVPPVLRNTPYIDIASSKSHFGGRDIEPLPRVI